MSQRLSPSSQTNYIVDKNKLYNSEINSDNKVIIKHEESNLFNNDVSENNSIIKNTKKLSEDDINEINLLNIKNTEEIHNFSAQEFADNTHLNFYIQLSIENKYNMLNFTEYKNILDSDIFNFQIGKPLV